MADDTLSPKGLQRKIIKTTLEPQDRYALAELKRNTSGTVWAFIRGLLIQALEMNGWPLDRRIEEYTKYRVECLRTGTANPFESE